MRRTLQASALLLALMPLGASGCFWVTTKHEGKELRRSVNTLETQVATQQEALPKLQQVLDEATKLLARNSADVGAEVSNLGQDMKTLNGLVQEATRYAEEVRDSSARQDQRIEALELRLAELEKKSMVIEKTAAQLWDEGSSAMRASRFEDARNAFRSLLVKYPNDGKAPDAQFQRGESYFKEKRYQESLGEFQRVFEKYPKHGMADNAAFRAGEAATLLKWCTDARAYFGLLLKRWPKSELAGKTKTKDAELRKNAKNKARCQS
jgi:TolA-binding protein